MSRRRAAEFPHAAIRRASNRGPRLVGARAAVAAGWRCNRLFRLALRRAADVAPLRGRAGDDGLTAVTEDQRAAHWISVDLDTRTRLEAALQERPRKRIL